MVLFYCTVAVCVCVCVVNGQNCERSIRTRDSEYYRVKDLERRVSEMEKREDH